MVADTEAEVPKSTVQAAVQAAARLLREGGRLVPRGLRIRACLLEARLPSASPSGKAGKAGEPGEPGEPVELSAFEPFWLPARAARSEWLGIDLDAGCEWVAASEAVEVFSLCLDRLLEGGGYQVAQTEDKV